MKRVPCTRFAVVAQQPRHGGPEPNAAHHRHSHARARRRHDQASAEGDSEPRAEALAVRCRQFADRGGGGAVPAVSARRPQYRAPAGRHGGDRGRRARAVGGAADLAVRPGCRDRHRGGGDSERRHCAAGQAKARPLCRHRYPTDAGAGTSRRGIAPRHDQPRAARRHDRLQRRRQESDDPSFAPLWATAAELDAFFMIHPGNVAGADRLRSYYLNNLIGNPLDTTIAAACLIFGGVLERHPNFKPVMVHGGGFTPYQGGRWVHGWHVRPEPKVHLKHSPEKYLERFRYDTICHSKASLEFLIATAGADRVFLGSDYPYDMGMMDCVRHVRSLDIAPADRDAILGGHAASLLGL